LVTDDGLGVRSRSGGKSGSYSVSGSSSSCTSHGSCRVSTGGGYGESGGVSVSVRSGSGNDLSVGVGSGSSTGTSGRVSSASTRVSSSGNSVSKANNSGGVRVVEKSSTEDIRRQVADVAVQRSSHSGVQIDAVCNARVGGDVVDNGQTRDGICCVVNDERTYTRRGGGAEVSLLVELSSGEARSVQAGSG